jgi:hypothetical protein
MELFVYTVYLIGILAAFSALVVSIYASVPISVLMRGENAGRFPGLGATQVRSRDTSSADGRLATLDVSQASAA